MENRENLERYERTRKSVKTRLGMEAKNALKALREDFPDNPASMGYFYERFERLYCAEDPVGPWGGKKLIGSLCVHVPEELIYAAGAVPVRLCAGAYSTDQIGADFMPQKSCPLVKSTLGMQYLKLLPQYEKASLFVNPTTCDQKRKLGEVASEFEERFYALELPPTKDSEEARVYWQRVVKKFARKLEEVTGERITRKRLKSAIAKVARAQASYRRFHGLRMNERPLIMGKDAILVMNSYFFDDIGSWTEAMDALNGELEERLAKGVHAAASHAPRILLAGSPPIFPNLKVPLLIERLGGVIVADEACSSARLIHDSVAVDEGFMYDMLPAIADRYLKPCTCPNFTPNTDRQRRVLEMAASFGVDGVVYAAFSGCQLFEMEARAIGRLLERSSIPMIYIETDYSPEDTGQLSTRIDAFLESIKAKKKRARI